MAKALRKVSSSHVVAKPQRELGAVSGVEEEEDMEMASGAVGSGGDVGGEIKRREASARCCGGGSRGVRRGDGRGDASDG